MVVPIEQRFNAAVNVIRSLPKNGSYQPSNEMLLRFYAYFKQATLGPCKQERPAFWNVVDKAKWNAYNALGDISSNRAMELYVEELKTIIETMSYTDNVAEFMGSVNQLNAIDIQDLEAVAPDAIKKVRSRPNSPFASRESSPVRADEDNIHDATNVVAGLPANFREHADGFSSAGEYSDEEYTDTLESPLLEEQIHPEIALRSHQQHPSNAPFGPHPNPGDPLYHILCCVEAMRVDLQTINRRMDVLEVSLADMHQHQQLLHRIGKQATGGSSTLVHSLSGTPAWWPFRDITPVWFVVLTIVWPLVARRVAGVMFAGLRRRH